MMNDILQNDEKQEIKELRRQIISLQAQLEIERNRLQMLSGGNLLASSDIDLYPGEQQDFVLSILSQAKEKCATGTRPYDILDSILSVNTPVGKGKMILEELTRIFKRGDPSKESDIAALKAIGFTYTPSHKHPKLRFHDRYMYVLAGTPSDSRRGAKNKLSDISKCIAVDLKF